MHTGKVFKLVPWAEKQLQRCSGHYRGHSSQCCIFKEIFGTCKFKILQDRGVIFLCIFVFFAFFFKLVTFKFGILGV